MFTADLTIAINRLASAIERHNDIIAPPVLKRSEAEFGKANYEDAEKKEIASALTAHLTSEDSALNRPIRRGKKKVGA